MCKSWLAPYSKWRIGVLIDELTLQMSSRGCESGALLESAGQSSRPPGATRARRHRLQTRCQYRVLQRTVQDRSKDKKPWRQGRESYHAYHHASVVRVVTHRCGVDQPKPDRHHQLRDSTSDSGPLANSEHRPASFCALFAFSDLSSTRASYIAVSALAENLTPTDCCFHSFWASSLLIKPFVQAIFQSIRHAVCRETTTDPVRQGL